MLENNINIIIVSAIVILILVAALFLFRRAKKGMGDEGGNQQVYIGNLPYRTNERDLRKHFSSYGQINDVRIVKDRRSGRSKGYAFISFSNAREAKKSLSAHGKELEGRSLVVHIAKPR